jgi:hypothetical protein
MTTDNFCFYFQNRLIETSQTGGQWYSDTFPLVFPGIALRIPFEPICFSNAFERVCGKIFLKKLNIDLVENIFRKTTSPPKVGSALSSKLEYL